MNKKGHHELGHAPYIFLAGLIGFLIILGEKVYSKLKK